MEYKQALIVNSSLRSELRDYLVIVCITVGAFAISALASEAVSVGVKILGVYTVLSSIALGTLRIKLEKKLSGMKEQLQKAGYQIREIVPGKFEWKDEIGRLIENSSTFTRTLVYVGGHGTIGKNGRSHLQKSKIEDTEFISGMTHVRGDKFIFFSTCKSGGFVEAAECLSEKNKDYFAVFSTSRIRVQSSVSSIMATAITESIDRKEPMSMFFSRLKAKKTRFGILKGPRNEVSASIGNRAAIMRL